MKRNLLVVIAAVLLLGGCSATQHRYQPTLYGTDPSELASLNSLSVQRPVAILNAQETDDDFVLGKKGVNEYHATLHDLTETIVMNANRELTKRSVGTKSPTALNIRVKAASSDVTVLNVEATLEVEVIAGSGMTRQIKVTNKSPGSIPRAFNGAASLAVIEIFSDREILSYLAGR